MLLDQLGPAYPRHWVRGVALALVAVAAVFSMLAYIRWRDNEIAMRHKQSLPHSGALLVAVGLMLGVAAVIAYLLMH